jgi:hypothetical protein
VRASLFTTVTAFLLPAVFKSLGWGALSSNTTQQCGKTHKYPERRLDNIR